jgi:hypothetical protein
MGTDNGRTIRAICEISGEKSVVDQFAEDRV